MSLRGTKHVPYKSHQKLPEYQGQPMGMTLVTARRYDVKNLDRTRRFSVNSNFAGSPLVNIFSYSSAYVLVVKTVHSPD